MPFKIVAFFQNSLYRKLLVAFVVVALFPYLLFFLYTLYYGEQKIVEKIIADQNIQAQNIIDSIESHLLVLQKEIDFLASLDLMDDIIAEDIDKRISRLLSQKKEDIGREVEVFIVTDTVLILSSSHKENIAQYFPYTQHLHDEGSFFEEKNLYIYSKVNASFDQNKKLGYLVLQYPLDNLKSFFHSQKSVHIQLYNPKTQQAIGAKLPFEVDVNNTTEIENDHLVVMKRLSGILKDFYIIYGEDKESALVFLYDLTLFILLMIPLALLITLLTAHYITKSILKPILELTHKTEIITSSKNYAISINNDGSKDEIARLSLAFNKMLQTTHNALGALEKENRLRLKRFVSLIEIFNKIIQTNNEDECIQSSLEEFEHLSDKKLVFKKNVQDKPHLLHLYLHDFERGQKTYFGSIELNIDALRDVNEQKFYRSIASMITLQLEHIRLIERTRSASEAKSAFISSMSHELRTPLNAIISFTQYLLAYEEMAEEQQDILSHIEKSAHYLLGMINEVLDIAKIEAGKMQAHYETLDLRTLLQEVYAMSSVLAEDKGLRLTLDTESLLDSTIKSDPKLLKQILLNLISNAIKFTQNGEIKILAKSQGDTLFVHVIDTGIGISQENLAKLFEDFTQLENVMHTQHKGTGLGLSLSRKLAHLLDGELMLESEGESKGSEAILQLRAIHTS